MITGNYVLTYLYNQPKLTQFVIQGLVSLFARITKLGWFDAEEEEFVFRDVITDISKFLQVGFPPESTEPSLCLKLTCYWFVALNWIMEGGVGALLKYG